MSKQIEQLDNAKRSPLERTADLMRRVLQAKKPRAARTKKRRRR